MLKKYLTIFFISMVPLIELRGAIPVSQAYQLPLIQSYIVCVLGNMIPVPVIYLFARKVLEWGKDKKYIGRFFTFCIEKGHKGGVKLKEKAGQGLFVALLLFVGIPIPFISAFNIFDIIHIRFLSCIPILHICFNNFEWSTLSKNPCISISTT